MDGSPKFASLVSSTDITRSKMIGAFSCQNYFLFHLIVGSYKVYLKRAGFQGDFCLIEGHALKFVIY